MIRSRTSPNLYVHFDPKINTYLTGTLMGAIVFEKDKGDHFINKVLCAPNSWEAVPVCDQSLVAPKDSKAADFVLQCVRRSNPGYDKN